MKEKIVLTPKVVADMAVQYIKDLFPGIEAVEVESIRQSWDWQVTVSYPAINAEIPNSRKCKVIVINSRRRVVEGMR